MAASAIAHVGSSDTVVSVAGHDCCIRELPDEPLGVRLYPAALQLLERLEALRDWRGVTVAELGAGTGAVAIGLAKLGARVIATDFETATLENLQFNVDRNEVGPQVDVLRWDWAEALPQPLTGVEYCVGSEVAYAGNAALLCKAVAALRRHKAHRKLLDREQLHDGRYQLYLPFKAPFTSRAMLGAGDLVLEVLEDYFAGPDFGIDHVSVLTAGSPSGNQSLHPDVPYFKGLAVSVHTALQDVTLDMGPTYFCPCTGEALAREEWATSAAIKMQVLKARECLASGHTPALTRRGTVTIYDGAMFHKGLANGSGRERHILKLEVGAADFPVRRNYVGSAPRAAQKQAARFREAFGRPRMGARRRA